MQTPTNNFECRTYTLLVWDKNTRSHVNVKFDVEINMFDVVVALASRAMASKHRKSKALGGAVIVTREVR